MLDSGSLQNSKLPSWNASGRASLVQMPPPTLFLGRNSAVIIDHKLPICCLFGSQNLFSEVDPLSDSLPEYSLNTQHLPRARHWARLEREQ